MDRPHDLVRHKRAAQPIGLPDLPKDIFLLIISNLEAWDFVRSRKVSRSWRRAFSDPEYLRVVLKKYPFARELRALSTHRAFGKPIQASDVDWRGMFDEIAARYFHLTHGKARSVTHYKSVVPEHGRVAHWHPVSPWDYHESQPGGRLYHHQSPLTPYESHQNRPSERAYLFRPSFWSYEDGLLLYSPPRNVEYQWDDRKNITVPVHMALVLVDLETEAQYPVPFDITKRKVRNFRLKERTLIVEWAEEVSYHALNDLERVHRHYASCYDIELDTSDTQMRKWTIKFRSEFKTHYLGLPLNSRDRFFSVHTRTHYLVYFWQPNRSMYTGDEELPIETLYVWDISRPSRYFPSLDPAGRHRADPPASFTADRCGPFVVSRFSYRDLDHFGIRQHSAISLMSFALDSTAGTVTVRENVCIAGQGYFDPAERLWCARTTSFPFSAHGPHLRKEWDGSLPPYRGNGSMETADVLEAEKWFLGIMDVVDPAAHVRFSLVETVFTGQFVENKKLVRIESLDSRPMALEDDLAKEICHMGRIAGDERFLVGQNSNQEIVVLRF